MVKINTGFLKFLSSFEMPAPSVPATGDITRFLYTCDRKKQPNIYRAIYYYVFVPSLPRLTDLRSTNNSKIHQRKYL